METQNATIKKALDILNKAGEGVDPKEILDLNKKLKEANAFRYARRILELARRNLEFDDQIGLLLDQQCALCTYKDADLPLGQRLEHALKILKDGYPKLDKSNNQETLGLAGAIFKLKWEFDGLISNLEISYYYYNKGFKQGIKNDDGYTAINAAFIADLIAYHKSRNDVELGKNDDDSIKYKKEAKSIRENIINILVSDNYMKSRNYWNLVTVAEAYFGLRQYDKAKPWLINAFKLKKSDDWDFRTTIKQLTRLVTLHEDKDSIDIQSSKAWETIITTSKINKEALQGMFSGKVGLALSGGGFRASLYHIGVLAYLAEKDMLRHIETLSCVSGGSIIGAYYYLELRNLLQTTADDKITQNHYIEIVERIAHKFLKGVQRNIRTRIASNFWDNINMIFNKKYSHTNRIGKLYEQILFSQIDDGENHNPRWLNKAFIHPVASNGEKNENFKPKYDNWNRKNKVPILILNATTLNTGHNWQFTASYMGESPASIQEIDGNYRLRRMYYENDDKSVRRIRYGEAVAASSCVPGLFEPLPLSDLYPSKIVRLVDGGVHDNQGIVGLLEQDCNVFLVSDASGQMGSLDDPQHSVLSVPMRSNDILMERVRNAEYQVLKNRKQAGLIKELMFVHLKMNLDVELIDWVKCEDPSDETLLGKTKYRSILTPYDIRKKIQQKIAVIRTDLDSFNDTEAFALMTSGYQMCQYQFRESIKGFNLSDKNHDWNFLSIAKELKDTETPESTEKLLEAGQERMLKIWRLIPALKVIAVFLGIGVLVAFFWVVIKFSHLAILSAGDVGWIVFWLLVGFIVGKTLIKIIRIKKTLTQVALGIGVAILGFILSHLHLAVFDKLYLKKGRRYSRNK